MVWFYLQKIISGNWENLKIPEWLEKHHTELVSNLHDIEVIKKYTIYHDCGKHLVKTVDEAGKSHYPNHEEASHNYWLEYFPNEDIVAWLILNDMFFHICSASDLDNNDFTKQDLCTLLLTALAEVHANKERFGGTESVSFKSKYKHLVRRGNKLCKMFERPEENYGHSYIFCPNDLSESQKLVQSSHVSIEMARKFKLDYHPSLVCLKVKDEKKLKKVILELIDYGINFTIFREPDINNRITCVATEPLFNNKRDLLKRYCLL